MYASKRLPTESKPGVTSPLSSWFRPAVLPSGNTPKIVSAPQPISHMLVQDDPLPPPLMTLVAFCAVAVLIVL